MKTIDVIHNIITLPSRLRGSGGNVSFFHLLRQSGYFEAHFNITESAVRDALAADLQCVIDWIQFFEDQRTGSGWYLNEDAPGFVINRFTSNPWTVWESVEYPDLVCACAGLIVRMIEEARSWL